MSATKTELTMEDLFEQAEREGLWFFTSHQQIWFSPRELKEQRAQGRFRWGVSNWQLRDPSEYLLQAQRELEAAQKHFDGVKANIENEARLASTKG